MNLELLQQAINGMKQHLEAAITTATFNGRNCADGHVAKQALIRSQGLIFPIHEVVKRSLADELERRLWLQAATRRRRAATGCHQGLLVVRDCKLNSRRIEMFAADRDAIALLRGRRFLPGLLLHPSSVPKDHSRS